jgi:hypothetical protein
VNSANNVNIIERAKTIRDTTLEWWSCCAVSTHTKDEEVSALASTTVIVGHAELKAVSLKGESE